MSTQLHLFSFGTLQDPAVQQAVFGRELHGSADVLRGFTDEVRGQVFSITPQDLAAADEYEIDDYARLEVRLGSGLTARVHVDKAHLPGRQD